MKQSGRNYERVLVCGGCETVRIDIINHYGHITKRTYRYPEAYLLPRGEHALSQEERDFIRLANVQSDLR